MSLANCCSFGTNETGGGSVERGGEAESEGGFLNVPSTIHLPRVPPRRSWVLYKPTCSAFNLTPNFCQKGPFIIKWKMFFIHLMPEKCQRWVFASFAAVIVSLYIDQHLSNELDQQICKRLLGIVDMIEVQHK